MKKILLFLVCIVLALTVIGCKQNDLSDEELIEKRIDSFITSYNNGDFDGVLESMDSRARNQYESMANLLSGISLGFGIGGFSASSSVDFSDLFGFSVGSISGDGDLMSVDVSDIEFTGETTAVVYATMVYSSSLSTSEELIKFIMVKEDNDWFIRDMRDDYGNHSNSNSSSDVNSDINSASKVLDAFDGIEFIVDGISPYCEISVNNQGCSLDVQKYVEYSFDKEKYANGDTVTVTAELTYPGKNEGYSFKSSTHTFTVSGQPEYISSVDGVDLTFLREELDDYVTAKIASAIGTQDFFGSGVYYPHTSWRGIIDTIFSHGINEEYFSCLKLIKHSLMGKNTPYNKYSFIYTFSLEGHYNDTSLSKTLYVAIDVNNIIKYPDGSIKWGTNSPNDFDYLYQTDSVGVENCVTTSIMNDSANYNITKITD